MLTIKDFLGVAMYLYHFSLRSHSLFLENKANATGRVPYLNGPDDIYLVISSFWSLVMSSSEQQKWTFLIDFYNSGTLLVLFYRNMCGQKKRNCFGMLVLLHFDLMQQRDNK